MLFVHFYAALGVLIAPMSGGMQPRATETCAVLVSMSGMDTPSCGRSSATPCRTINYGIARAISDGLSCVFVQAGNYNSPGRQEPDDPMEDNEGGEVGAWTPPIATTIEAPAAACDLSCATLDATLPEGRGLLTFAPIVPSPTRGRSEMRFTLPTASQVHVDVFDARGRMVRVIEDSYRGAGTHTVEWDGRGGDGQSVPIGFYVVRLQALGQTVSRSVTVIR